MPSKLTSAVNLECQPLTPKRWHDLETLFGKQGACGGCWCMWWRLTRSQFDKQKGSENRKALKNIVDSGETPGIIAYMDDQPAAWCSVAPRESYPALERSRVLKRVDDELVWSVVCFFIAKPFRGRGLMVPVLKGAVEYAEKLGARIVEGYPIDPKKKMPSFALYTGLASAFQKAGFAEVLRRSETRPIMRCYLAKR